MIRDVAGTPPAATTPASRPPAQAATPASASAAPETPKVPLLNPRMRIDTELNLVVLEFRDDSGEVRNTIPTPREIDAYRLAAMEGSAAPAPAPDLDVTR